MKLQVKIVLLLSMIFGIILFSFLSYQSIRIREKKILYLENSKNQELVLDKVLELNRLRYEQLLNDNSGWDDMIAFAQNPDREWAIDNVDFFVNSFKLSFVLVYNQDMKPVYQFGDTGCLNQLVHPDQKVIQSLFAHSAFSHHFQYCGNNLIEIFGATIVPATDIDKRITPARGYLFIGRKWDATYLNGFTQATNHRADLVRGSDFTVPQKDKQRNYFTRVLKDNLGKAIAILVFSKDDPTREDMEVFLYLSFGIALIVLALMVIFLFFFRRIIVLPLSKITTTLNTRNPEYIESLNNHTDEFKTLGNLILQFFWQEEVLKKNNLELHETNATKDKLFSIIAHDLKNPIGNILVISKLLKDSLANDDRQSASELIELIGSQSQETLSLLETLFDWSKSQTGQIHYKPEILNLKMIVDQVLANLIPAAKVKNITIETNSSEHLLVYADPNMLNAIFRNLVTNAVKFTNSGGTVRIAAEMKEDAVEITVSDTGIGMNPETQAKLFHIDTNLTTMGTADEKGTGLGLIICREFIEKHGGHIKVKSEAGKGSQFMFNLPFPATSIS